MKILSKLSLIAALAMVLLGALYGIDRFLLAPSCPDCSAELARNLPLFDETKADGSEDGLRRIQAGTMEFRAHLAGSANKDGEGVILLHGFPETSIMWERLLETLSQNGYRAIAFDQRGYSPGARPFTQNEYSKAKLASDVIAIADAAGFKKFHVIGHDFGGAVAWTVADRHRERVLSLTSLSMPHPLALAKTLASPSPQWPASAYVLFYRLPILPEFILGFDRAALLARWKWQDHPERQVEEYRRVFGEPGALRAALNWYRAFEFRSLDPLSKIRPPTLFLWGREDGAFSRASALATVNYMDGAYRLHTLNAGHNLMLEAPNAVTEEVLAHLQSARQLKEQWVAALDKDPQEAKSTCDEIVPKCLRIQLSPHGRNFRIRNRCDESYRGVVRVSCSRWAPDETIEYRFSLGAKAEMAQESAGGKSASNGTCYYRHRLCAKVPVSPKPRAATFMPFLQ